MTFPNDLPFLALDVVPPVFSSSGSPTKLPPLILSNIQAYGTGLGIIASEMFEPTKWYLPSFSPHPFPHPLFSFTPSPPHREVSKEESEED